MIYKPESTKRTITKKFLLEKNTQETYLEYYLGIPVKKGLFKNPLRVDHKPTASFYRQTNGDIIFKDFNGSFKGNFISVVMFKYNCCYATALKIIAKDFGYVSDSGEPCKKVNIVQSSTNFEGNKKAKIQIQKQNFTPSELAWWKTFGVDDYILYKFKVFSCKAVFLNDELFALSHPKNPIFGYYRGTDSDDNELWRIYFPKRKEFRFISNWSASMIQGAKQLPKVGSTLVITKSLKDVMTLYSFGITAIAPNSEHLFISEKQFEKLKARFKNIYVFYDNDLTGISNMNKIRKKFNVKCLWIPKKHGVKDISDFYQRYGQEETLKLINSIYVNRN